MMFECVRITRPVRNENLDRLGRSMVDYMVKTRQGTYNPAGVYDRGVAVVLALASMDAYYDIDTFARSMARIGLGLGTETVGVTHTNAELLVNATAYLVQSADGRVAILAFRGTAMKNVTKWLMDTGTLEAFVIPGTASKFDGNMHGGLYLTSVMMWPSILSLLEYALKGYSICAGALRAKDAVRGCVTGDLDIVGHLPPLPPKNAPDKLEALYITGHGIGGALAVISALFLRVSPIVGKLRGIFTYGQPMIGDEDLAMTWERARPRVPRIHRHIYGVDVVPRLPPRAMGRFVHFGNELASSDMGWMFAGADRRFPPETLHGGSGGAVSQVLTGVGAAVLGLFPTIQPQMLGVPLRRWLPLPYSLADHDPLNYLRTSENGFPRFHLPSVVAPER